MTLTTVVPELLAALPELRPICDAEFLDYGDQPLAPYPVFGIVFRPAVFAAIDRADESFLRRAFSFYERVASEPDDNVNALTHIELIEDVANDNRRLPVAWRYMGEHTKELARLYARETKRQFGKEVPLPE